MKSPVKQSAALCAMVPALLMVFLCAGALHAQPCGSYHCDSLVVRGILDTNGLQNVPVYEVSDTMGGGRICSLRVSGNDYPGRAIRYLPASVCRLTSLRSFIWNHTQVTSLPDSLGALGQLEELDLSFNALRSLPASIGNLGRLTRLDLESNQLPSLPAAMGNLAQLIVIGLKSNLLQEIPVSMGQLNPVAIDLSYNLFQELPGAVLNMRTLMFLNLGGNYITGLPDSITNLSQAHTIELQDNRITLLPETFTDLVLLHTVNLSANNLASLPDSLGAMTGLNTLMLGSNELTEIPPSIVNLAGLRMLFLDRNRLTRLPEGIAGMEDISFVTLHLNELCSLTTAQDAWARERSYGVTQGAGPPETDMQYCNSAWPDDGPPPNPFTLTAMPYSGSLVRLDWSPEKSELLFYSDIKRLALWYKAGSPPEGPDDTAAVHLADIPLYYSHATAWLDNLEPDTEYHFLTATGDWRGNWSAATSLTRAAAATSDTLNREASFEGRLYYHTPTNMTVYDPRNAVRVTVASAADALGTMAVRTTVTPAGPTGQYLEVKAVDISISEKLTQVMTAADLSFSYADLDVSDVDEHSLGVYHHDGDEYVFYGGEVDTVNKTVTVTVPHFSVYSLQGLRKNAGIRGGAVVPGTTRLVPGRMYNLRGAIAGKAGTGILIFIDENGNLVKRLRLK